MAWDTASNLNYHFADLRGKYRPLFCLAVELSILLSDLEVSRFYIRVGLLYIVRPGDIGSTL